MNNDLCHPVTRLIQEFQLKELSIKEIISSDYHFKEYKIIVQGTLKEPIQISDPDLFINEDKIFCKCHWTSIYFENENNLKLIDLNSN